MSERIWAPPLTGARRVEVVFEVEVVEPRAFAGRAVAYDYGLLFLAARSDKWTLCPWHTIKWVEYQ